MCTTNLIKFSKKRKEKKKKVWRVKAMETGEWKGFSWSSSHICSLQCRLTTLLHLSIELCSSWYLRTFENSKVTGSKQNVKTHRIVHIYRRHKSMSNKKVWTYGTRTEYVPLTYLCFIASLLWSVLITCHVDLDTIWK